MEKWEKCSCYIENVGTMKIKRIKWNIKKSRKKTICILNDDFYKEQAFLYPILNGMVDYNASKDNPAHYFNQKLLNFNQHFAPDADFLFFSQISVWSTHLSSTIYFAIHKIKSGTLTAETLKINLKKKLKGL